MQNIGFFNGEYEYGQDEFSMFFRNICSSGIGKKNAKHNGFRVSISGLIARIDTGYAILDGFYFYNSEMKDIVINKPQNYERIDSIVIRLSRGAANNISIERKIGVESLTPIAPEVIKENDVYELSLAQIRVSKLGEVKLTDERNDEEVCGVLTPQIGKIRNVFVQKSEPSESERVSGSIWIEELQ